MREGKKGGIKISPTLCFGYNYSIIDGLIMSSRKPVRKTAAPSSTRKPLAPRVDTTTHRTAHQGTTSRVTRPEGKGVKTGANTSKDPQRPTRKRSAKGSKVTDQFNNGSLPNS